MSERTPLMESVVFRIAATGHPTLREYVIRTVYLTSFALTAFALNSILCRLALKTEEIDPAGFTTIRLVSGAIALALILQTSGHSTNIKKRGNWLSAFFLFAYAACFSFAYTSLTAGTGALILFGSVQLTMILVGLRSGHRPGVPEWLGLAGAFAGLVVLVLPGLTSPPLTSSLLMAAAGIAWGGYSLRGKGAGDASGETAGNFLRTVPMAAVLTLIFIPRLNVTGYGIALAVVSGAVTSGVGYAIWYTALKDLTAFKAAVVQLAVPLLTAVIGVLILSENADVRLTAAGMLILGGILVTILSRSRVTH